MDKDNRQREYIINRDKYLVSLKDSVTLEIYKNGKKVIHKDEIQQILVSAISLALKKSYGKVFNEKTVNKFFDAIETVIRDAAIAGTDIEVITHARNILHER